MDLCFTFLSSGYSCCVPSHVFCRSQPYNSNYSTHTNRPAREPPSSGTRITSGTKTVSYYKRHRNSLHMLPTYLCDSYSPFPLVPIRVSSTRFVQEISLSYLSDIVC